MTVEVELSPPRSLPPLQLECPGIPLHWLLSFLFLNCSGGGGGGCSCCMVMTVIGAPVLAIVRVTISCDDYFFARLHCHCCDFGLGCRYSNLVHCTSCGFHSFFRLVKRSPKL